MLPADAPPRRLLAYADTAPLDDEALRDLAAHSDPQSRVLACWRLMTRGQSLRTTASDGPDEGVRRILLLNLAVAREVDLLTLLARRDPAVTTRKEALVLLARIDATAGLEVLRALLREPDDDLLLLVLGEPSTLPWSLLGAEIGALLRNNSVVVRRAVVDLLLADGEIPEVVRRAVTREPDRQLRDHILARWAASSEHAALLELATGHLREPTLQALLAADRKYPPTMLTPLADLACSERVLGLLAWPETATERRWLLTRVQALLAAGDDPGRALDLLAAAYQDVELDGLAPGDLALVQLLTGREITRDRLRPELERLLEGPSTRLALRAAEALLAGTREFPLALRRFAVLYLDWYDDWGWDLLERWAESDDYRSLLAAAIDPGGLGVPVIHDLRRPALAALAAAGRTFSATELAPLTELADPGCRESLQALTDPA